MPTPSRSILPLGILVVAWAAALAGASLAVEDAWHLAGPGAGGTNAIAVQLAPLFSIVAGAYSLVAGGALFGLTWLAIPRAERRTLPWSTGVWGLATFIALCGGLTLIVALPTVGLALALLAWLLVADAIRVVVTAIVVQLSRRPTLHRLPPARR